jgi:peptidyl-prolyl cis-trans isomerase D
VIALLGFLVMSGLDNGGTSIFGEDRTSIGSINGTKLKSDEYRDLEQKMQTEARKKNKRISDNELSQVSEEAWDEILREKLITNEYEKLGITVTNKELKEMLTNSEFADPMIRQQFTDPNTGVFDAGKVKEYLTSLPKQDSTARKQWREFEDGLIKNRLGSKYTSMLAMGFYTPKAVVVKTIENRNAVAAIEFVKIPFTSISDDKVKVTDADVTAMIAKNAKSYTIEKELRSADYVNFDIVPSSEDTAASLGIMMSKREDFTSSADVIGFVSKNSDMVYDKEFYASGRLDMPKVDSANNAPVGSLVGPYFEDDMFKITKVLAKKNIADSVRSSHILIGITKDISEETAKAKIDSIEKAILGGTNFEQIAAAMSDDGNSKAKGGDMGYLARGALSSMSEFNDFIFEGVKGNMKTVKTRYGWHLIKIVDQKDFKVCTQSATYAKKLIAGDKTKNTQYTAATNLLKTAKDKASFEAAAKKAGLNIKKIEAVTSTQSSIQGVEKARELVRWIFENKSGNVSSIINAETSYIVALMNQVMPTGLAPANLVKARLEGDIKNNKKTALIAATYKGMTDLNAIASKSAQAIQSADTIRQEGVSSASVAQEKRILGAAFTKGAQGKVVGPIQGFDGVYYIKVKSVVPAPASSADPLTINQERSMQANQLMQNLGRALPVILQKKSKVVDNRGMFM